VSTDEQRPLAITLCSGGLDSSVLAYYLRELGFKQHLLSVDYGQRHRRELQSAAKIAEHLGVEHTVVDLTSLRVLLKGSALTSDDVAVPHGHYAAPNMAQTVVPNRNAILLSVAVGLAVAEGASLVSTAVHAGDHPIYPDCRPEFIEALNGAVKTGTDGYGLPDLHIEAPFVHKTKEDIAALAHLLSVPVGDTWSCYEGGDIHCGRCGTCVERREALHLAGVEDPTPYAVPYVIAYA
jgi:7-cyano-7-deazaguanine synthase